MRQPPGAPAVPTPDACGKCHPQQLADWKTTIHAHAASPGFRGQLIGGSKTFVQSCQLCHQPLVEQQRFRELGDADLRRTGSFFQQSLVEDKWAAYAAGRLRWGQNPALDAELAVHGVTCAACHMRRGKIFGPPLGQKPPQIDRTVPDPHPQTIRLQLFETAEFCAECHQFTMAKRAGDKPIQNTYAEWKASIYGTNHVACVFCHMPDRKHLFRGIHSPDMVGGALSAQTEWEIADGVVTATLTLINQGAGHAMPTYVTPRMDAHLQLLDAAGRVVAEATYVIARLAEPAHPTWRELSDTRLWPLKPVDVVVRAPADRAAVVRQWVDVDPDSYYRGLYERLLDRGNLEPESRQLIELAHAETLRNRYVVHEEEEKIE